MLKCDIIITISCYIIVNNKYCLNIKIDDILFIKRGKMILITVEVSNLNKEIRNYEAIYQYLTINNLYYYDIQSNLINILVQDSDDYFKVCMELMIAINNEALNAKLYISHSNEAITLTEIGTTQYQVFIQNRELRKTCLNNRNFKMNDQFIIRAHHQTLDSILYSLSVMCLKYERNFELIYNKYYSKLTQKQIADKYNITQAAVSKKLKSSNYEMFKLLVSRL